jgi:hypothetical protein
MNLEHQHRQQLQGCDQFVTKQCWMTHRADVRDVTVQLQWHTGLMWETSQFSYHGTQGWCERHHSSATMAHRADVTDVTIQLQWHTGLMWEMSQFSYNGTQGWCERCHSSATMKVLTVLQKSIRQHPHGTGVPRAAFITLCNMERDNPAVDTTNIDDPGCQM